MDTKLVEEYQKNGFAIVPKFASQETMVAMKSGILELVSEWADPPPDNGEKAVFKTDETQCESQGIEDYFMSSGRSVRFFWESEAIKKRVKEDAAATLLQLNKIGHCLHECMAPGAKSFREYSHSDKLRSLVSLLGYKRPVLPQSMYIVKNPRIGGEVTAHQDSTFLFTTPSPTCLGLWLALDDCTIENACLWARPGSHTEPVMRQFVRVPVEGNKGRWKMEFKQLVSSHDSMEIAGRSIESKGDEDPEAQLRARGFVPIECKAGDLVIIHGQVEHLSLPNNSDKPRHTFQLHLVESADGITWSKDNWLQYPEGVHFPAL